MAPTPTKKSRVKVQTRWQDEFYVTIYQGARAGLTEHQIYSSLGVSSRAWHRWKQCRPAIQDALNRGKTRDQEVEEAVVEFHDYLYHQLSPQLQDLWDEIMEAEKTESGLAYIEALLQKNGKRTRQRLFLYALSNSNFNVSEACRQLNVRKATIFGWKQDPEFAEMMREIEWHKGNFFEHALIRQVKAGVTPAILFANKTFNKDRGYGEKVEVEHKGRVEHAHAHIAVDELDLPRDVQRQILKAVQKKEMEVIDGDVVSN